MASRTRQLSRSLRTISCSSSGRPICPRTPFCSRETPIRPFSKSRIRSADTQSSSNPSSTSTQTSPNQSRSATDSKPSQSFVSEELEPSEYLIPSKPLSVGDLSPEERADYETLSKDEQVKYLALQNHYKAYFESPETKAQLETLAEEVERRIERTEGPLQVPRREPLSRKDQGFWSMDEDDEFAMVPDDDDDPSDVGITSVAESELEVHREIREYTRIIAWDMPLLQKFAKPFTVPRADQPLRFRYTTYMGETHPASRKVVVQFCISDLPNLTEKQQLKLKKLAGPRYNPETEVVKMSSEKYEHAAQNKRYLGDVVNSLIREARDGKDTLEDVPLDLRHFKPRARPRYPDEWKLSPDRVKTLLEQRRKDQVALPSPTPEEDRRDRAANQQQPLDGKQLVESYVHALADRPGRTSTLRR